MSALGRKWIVTVAVALTDLAVPPLDEHFALLVDGDAPCTVTLLLLESAEPRSWDRSWQDGESYDSFDQFVSTGQLPVR